MREDVERSGTQRLAATYGDAFFSELEAVVESSARVVVPVVCKLLSPRSVLDVGCGRGTWLRIFREQGVADTIGIDGPHVAADTLEIPAETFIATDLTEPFDLGRRFDLAVSLEVGEHLDPEVAPAFVRSLVAHAPAVLFSAAIPLQGGPGHVNEAWQSEWANRFAAHGYSAIDAVRPVVWRDERVAYWYAQNTLLYVDETTRRSLDREADGDAPFDIVHPEMFTRARTFKPKAPEPSLSHVLKELPRAARRAAARRLGGRREGG